MPFFPLFQAKLESKLFALQKQLQSLHQSLSTIWSHDNQTSYLTNQHVALPVNQRLSGQLAKCGKSLQECCQDLLVLSILTPAAPWVSATFMLYTVQAKTFGDRYFSQLLLSTILWNVELAILYICCYKKERVGKVFNFSHFHEVLISLKTAQKGLKELCIKYLDEAIERAAKCSVCSDLMEVPCLHTQDIMSRT